MKKNTVRFAMALIAGVIMLFTIGGAVFGENDVIAKNVDTGVTYTTVSDAWAAAQSGSGVVMTADWNLTSRLELGENKTARIYMNGHIINRNLSDDEANGEVICMRENSQLTLSGRDEKQNLKSKVLDYTGWVIFENEFSRDTRSVRSGGLVTGGWSWTDGGCIYMEEKCRLTLDNVALAGNMTQLINGYIKTGWGGAVYMSDDECRLSMINGAVIQNNQAECGGGVAIKGDSCYVSMNSGSMIQGNSAQLSGGGIYCRGTALEIHMSENSGINNNFATDEAGGIFMSSNIFSLQGDGTTTISDNTAYSGDGGAMDIQGDNLNSTSALISNMTIAGNTSSYRGGAIANHHRNVTFTDLIIKDNTAENCGGGIYNSSDGTVITDCTITGNKSKEGGGVFAYCTNNISLKNKVIIKDNTERDGTTKDDLFLEDVWYSTAYIISQPSADSEIGIRTDASSDRKIGEKTDFNELVFFSDEPGWHVEKSGSELYLKKGERYLVTVNGKKVGAYAEGAKVAVNGTPDDTKIFKNWEPAADVEYADSSAAVTSFIMPKHDVELTASYADKVSEFSLTASYVHQAS